MNVDPRDLLDWHSSHGRVPAPVVEAITAAVAATDVPDEQREEAEIAALLATADHLRRQPTDPTVALVDQLPDLLQTTLAEIVRDVAAAIAADSYYAQQAANIAAERRRQRTESRAHRLNERLQAIAAYERGVVAEIGQLMRDVDGDRKRNPHAAPKVDDLAYMIGLSKPTLYAYASKLPRDDGLDPREMSLATLARYHAEYGYGGNDRFDGELWGRRPELSAWRAAIRALYDAASDGEDFDPWTVEPTATAPGAEVLERRYREMVDALAAGWEVPRAAS